MFRSDTPCDVSVNGTSIGNLWRVLRSDRPCRLSNIKSRSPPYLAPLPASCDDVVICVVSSCRTSGAATTNPTGARPLPDNTTTCRTARCVQGPVTSVSIAVTRPPSIRLGDYFKRTYHYTEGHLQHATTKVTVILTRLLSSQLDLFCVVPQGWVLTWC